MKRNFTGINFVSLNDNDNKDATELLYLDRLAALHYRIIIDKNRYFVLRKTLVSFAKT